MFEKLMKFLLGEDKRTSIAGWAKLVYVLAFTLFAVMDNDPNTIANLSEVQIALAAVGLVVPDWLNGILSKDSIPQVPEVKEKEE